MIKWKVGAYLRLSSDDGDKIESNSITNQKEIVNQFVNRESDMKIAGYYIDDGYTGTDFERPDFQRMVEDIKNNKINTVIVKDLSRLGRNYIAVGKYIEEVFPNYNVRFIAINDNVDSFKDPNSLNNLIVPFKNLMNDEYARDISNKVKSVLNSKKKNGEFIGITVPYGYLRNPYDKHKFIIDPTASKVIKKIFKMILDGKSKSQIIDSLNNLGILPPKAYKLKKESEICDLSPTMMRWDRKKLDKVIKNRVYVGELIQSKLKRISHKVHKLVYNSPDNWIVIPNHHEAIISEDVFTKAQNILYERDIKVNKDKEYNLFVGYLKCKECGSQLTVIKGKRKNYYYCREYIRNKKCSTHSVEKDTIERIVIKLINMQIELVVDIDENINKVIENEDVDYDLSIINTRLKEVNAYIEKYEKLIKEIKNDFGDNLISEEEYMEYELEYKKFLANLNEEKIKIDNMIRKSGPSKSKEWIKRFIENRGFDKLSRKILGELVDEILIDKDKNIIIRFKYENEYFEAIDFLKEHNCDIMSRQKEVI